MNDERYVLLEKYNENEVRILKELAGEHLKLTDYAGSNFLTVLGLVAGVIGCFMFGPISIVLGIILAVVLPTLYTQNKNKKTYVGTVFEGKYKFGLLNGLKKAYEPTCAQVHAINVQKRADYDKVLRVLEKEMAKHEKSINRS